MIVNGNKCTWKREYCKSDGTAILLNFCEDCTYLVYFSYEIETFLTLLLLHTTCLVLANSVDPDQLASEEANWSEFALFVIKYVSFYQTPGSSNRVSWKLEKGVAS